MTDGGGCVVAFDACRADTARRLFRTKVSDVPRDVKVTSDA
jgi:hypothetical protein